LREARTLAARKAQPQAPLGELHRLAQRAEVRPLRGSFPLKFCAWRGVAGGGPFGGPFGGPGLGHGAAAV
jgi:hypothetical protein